MLIISYICKIKIMISTEMCIEFQSKQWSGRDCQHENKIRLKNVEICYNVLKLNCTRPTLKEPRYADNSCYHSWANGHLQNKLYPMKYVHSFVLLCFVVVVFSVYSGFIRNVYPYPSRLLHWHLHWHWGNQMIAPVPVKLPGRIWLKSAMNKPKQGIILVHNS